MQGDIERGNGIYQEGIDLCSGAYSGFVTSDPLVDPGVRHRAFTMLKPETCSLKPFPSEWLILFQNRHKAEWKREHVPPALGVVPEGLGELWDAGWSILAREMAISAHVTTAGFL